MLSSIRAQAIVEQNFPEWKIVKFVVHNGNYIFLTTSDLPGEEGYEAFVSVNGRTGAHSDYSPFVNGVPDSEVIRKFSDKR